VDVKAAARKLFVEDGLSYLDVGARLTIPEATVRNWSKKGHWETARDEIAGSAKSLYEMALKVLKAKLVHLESLPPEEVTTSVLDGLNKLFIVVQSARETVRLLEAAVIAGEEFVAFVRRTVPDEATRAKVYETWDAFLEFSKDAA
jgi:alkyl sulfatase BDS1-like metallo-beta-lactamase superfamily hydrolase